MTSDLQRLERLRTRLAEADERRFLLMRQRDELIHRLRGQPRPLPLRVLAEAAGIGTSYCSRIEHDEGFPRTGHELGG